jgi:hypothetical protein
MQTRLCYSGFRCCFLFYFCAGCHILLQRAPAIVGMESWIGGSFRVYSKSLLGVFFPFRDDETFSFNFSFFSSCSSKYVSQRPTMAWVTHRCGQGVDSLERADKRMATEVKLQHGMLPALCSTRVVYAVLVM